MHAWTAGREGTLLKGNMDLGTKTEKTLLVVSFGTASTESRLLDIAPVEKAIGDAAGKAWKVRRCFSSQMIIDMISKREGVRVDNVKEGIEKALSGGARDLVVQPTLLMKGIEYDRLRDVLEAYSDSFERISLGEPLLSSEEDISLVADALIEASAEHEDGRTAFVSMGHGTEAGANAIYLELQTELNSRGKNGHYIGTVEAGPSLDDVIGAVGRGYYEKVVLRPLMLVAGSHALKDMASTEDPGSWYSRFTAEGYDTVCITEGLGRLPAVRDIYARHARRAIGSHAV